jgi:hypothetical protein
VDPTVLAGKDEEVGFEIFILNSYYFYYTFATKF